MRASVSVCLNIRLSVFLRELLCVHAYVCRLEAATDSSKQIQARLLKRACMTTDPHIHICIYPQVQSRQDAIDRFNKDPEVFVFLLSTRAGVIFSTRSAPLRSPIDDDHSLQLLTSWLDISSLLLTHSLSHSLASFLCVVSRHVLCLSRRPWN